MWCKGKIDENKHNEDEKLNKLSPLMLEHVINKIARILKDKK